MLRLPAGGADASKHVGVPTNIIYIYIYICIWDHGSTVVKVLCYKSEGRWFDPSWCQWIFH